MVKKSFRCAQGDTVTAPEHALCEMGVLARMIGIGAKNRRNVKYLESIKSPDRLAQPILGNAMFSKVIKTPFGELGLVR